MRAALIVVLLAVVLVAAVVLALTPCERVVTPWYGYTTCR